MQIAIQTTTAQGIKSQVQLLKEAGRPVTVQAAANAKVEIAIDGVKQTGKETVNGKRVSLKRAGNNLVLDLEGEVLVEFNDFFISEGALLEGAGLNFTCTEGVGLDRCRRDCLSLA